MVLIQNGVKTASVLSESLFHIFSKVCY